MENDLRSPVAGTKIISFNADNAIANLESDAYKRWELQPHPINPERFKKLQEALERLSKNPDDHGPGNGSSLEEKNEWASYAKAEEERKAFLEASYNRFRLSAVPEFPSPNPKHFEYEEVEFPLPSGQSIKQPVAHVREASKLPELFHKTDTYASAPNQMTVGTNTENDDREHIQESKQNLFTRSDVEAERKIYVSKLIQRTKPRTSIPQEGQKVNVSYYGLLFPGTVVKRNLGSGTFTIRFEDNTVNDFPINSIVLR